MSVASFKAVREVEFEVRVGPFAHDRQRCKLSCKEGQWVGPLCKREGRGQRYRSLLKSCEVNVHPEHLIITYQNMQMKVRNI